MTFANLIKEYTENLQKVCKLKPEECDKNFETQTLLKNFVSISNIAKIHVFFDLFGKTNQEFKTHFLDLDLEKIFTMFQENKDLISSLHDNFSRKIWKQLLEKIVVLYFQCFILSCNKSKNPDDVKIIFMQFCLL